MGLFGNNKEMVDGALKRYEVIYRGGWKEYPKAKSGALGFNIMENEFILKETSGSKSWFRQRRIPYDSIKKFRIVKRSAGNLEALLASNAASVRATETDNTMEIVYEEDGSEILVRFEMLSGITVYAQQEKCQELMDLLRINKILPRINKEEKTTTEAFSVADELKKFKELLDMGVVTQEEFDAKKKQLLGI